MCVCCVLVQYSTGAELGVCVVYSYSTVQYSTGAELGVCVVYS